MFVLYSLSKYVWPDKKAEKTITVTQTVSTLVRWYQELIIVRPSLLLTLGGTVPWIGSLLHIHTLKYYFHG